MLILAVNVLAVYCPLHPPPRHSVKTCLYILYSVKSATLRAFRGGLCGHRHRRAERAPAHRLLRAHQPPGHRGHEERSRLQLLLAAVAARTKPALTRGPEQQFARTRHEKINTHQKAHPNR